MSGHHGLDPNAVLGVERAGLGQEPGAGLSPLVGVELHVGHPGVVVRRAWK
jgi:hypothetical protein